MAKQIITPETPFVVVIILTFGEFGYAAYLLFTEAHGFALFLAIRYALAEEWSPIHYIKEHVKRRCWKHIPFGQCVPNA